MNNTETTRPIDTLIGKLNALGYEAQFDAEAKGVRCRNNISFSVDDGIINTASEKILDDIVEWVTYKMQDKDTKNA